MVTAITAQRRARLLLVALVLSATSLMAVLAVPAAPGSSRRVAAPPGVASAHAGDPDAGPLTLGGSGGSLRTASRAVVPGEHAASPLTPPRPPRVPTRAELEQLIAALAHDDERWNAMRARYDLEQLGEAAVPALEDLLQRGDRQQRQLAATILYDALDEPTPALLRVAVEGLQHDRMPYDPGWPDGSGDTRQTWILNARAACEFLHRHAEAARPLLVAQLRSRDDQQRFHAAKLLALGSGGGLASLQGSQHVVVGTLAAHLADNHIARDAAAAVGALGSLGGDALPLLRRERARADPQAAAMLDYLIEHATKPCSDQADAHRRMQAHGLEHYLNILHCVACSRPVRDTPLNWSRGGRLPPLPPH